MKTNILQQFLNKGIIALEYDNEKEKLEAAIADLKQKLQQDKAKLVSYLLVAIDPNTPIDLPIFREIQNYITTEHWGTFVSNSRSKDIRKPAIRAVILDTIAQLAMDDIEIANLVYLSISDLIQQKLYELGQEQSIITSFLSECKQAIEKQATGKTRAKLPHLTLDEIGIDSSTLDEHFDIETLKTYLKSAVIPEVVEEGVRVNKQWLNNNTNTVRNWSTDFSEIAAEGIFNSMIPIIENYDKTLNDFLEYQNKYLESVNQQVQKIIQNNGFQSKMLWWNKTLHSPSLNKSYRDVNKAILPIILAYDLSQLVPFIYPESINYLLRETLRAIYDNKEPKAISFKDHFEGFLSHQPILSTLINEQKIPEQRILLLDFIRGLLYKKLEINDFNERLGIEETKEVSASDLTIWLFHNFQVQKFLAI